MNTITDNKTSILFSTKDDHSLTFKRIKTISLNDGHSVPNLYYDNVNESIIQKEFDYKLLFRSLVIVMTLLCFLIAIDTTMNYMEMRTKY